MVLDDVNGDAALQAAFSEALVFSATEASIDAGGTHALVVPMDSKNGGFISYDYSEAGGEGVTFSIDAGQSRDRRLLEELQPRSSDRLHVAGGDADTCVLTWANTETWLAPVTLSYTVRVVSMAVVRGRLERRLLAVAVQGPAEAVPACLAAGNIGVDCSDATTGHTPLMLAALHGRADTLGALIRAGASVAATERHGNTSLHLAALAGARAPVIRALLEGGAAVNARNAEGATPLLMASFRRAPPPASSASSSPSAAAALADGSRAGEKGDGDETVSSLLAARADARAVDMRGNTALHYAASTGRAALLRTLLAAGAPAAHRNGRGEGALSAAASSGDPSAVGVLLKAGAIARPAPPPLAGGDADAAAGEEEDEAAAAVHAMSEEADGAEMVRALSMVLAVPHTGASSHGEVSGEASGEEGGEVGGQPRHEAPSRGRAGGEGTGRASFGARCQVLCQLLVSPSMPSAAAVSALRSAAQLPMLAQSLRLSCRDGLELAALRLLDAGAPTHWDGGWEQSGGREGGAIASHDGSAAGAGSGGTSGAGEDSAIDGGIGSDDGIGAGGPLSLAAGGGHGALVSLLLRRAALVHTAEHPMPSAMEMRNALTVAGSRGDAATTQVQRR